MNTPQVFPFDTRVHGWRDASAALPAGGLWFKINSSQNGVEKFRQAISDLSGLLITDDVEYDVAPPMPAPRLGQQKSSSTPFTETAVR
jgi:hypothetical protein